MGLRFLLFCFSFFNRFVRIVQPADFKTLLNRVLGARLVLGHFNMAIL